MQTTTTFKRLLSAVMAVVMMLTVIPLATSAEGEATAAAKDTIAFGTYGENTLVWEILEKEADGDLLLITKDVLAKLAFWTGNPTAAKPVNYANSKIHAALNDGDTAFYATTFSDAEKAAMNTTTISYAHWDTAAKAKTTSDLTANVVIPSEAMATKYSLGAASLNGTATAYWLADAQATSATGRPVRTINAAGALTYLGSITSTATGYRAVITLKSGNYAKFPAVDGVTYTVNDQAVTYYATTSAVSFKVSVDTDNYAADELAVSLGDSALTAADGVYTIPAGTTAAVTVTGVTAQPADFTAYNEAVAKAGEVDKDLCDTTDLDAALAVDVSACTKLEQAKVDEAAAAILDAIANLKYKPADLTEYNKALELARTAFNDKNGDYYSIKLEEPVSQTSYEILLWDLLDKYEDDTDTPISSLTIDKQAEVDAATKELNDFVASIPIRRANTAAWSDALREVRNIKPHLFSNAAELIAEAEALVAENDYVALNLDITYQDEIDAATEALKAIYNRRIAIPVDFTALDAALEKAATYLEENYYKDDEMAGGTKAWEDFSAARDEALNLDRSLYETADDQSEVDKRTDALVRVMGLLDPFVRLTSWQKFVKSIKDFFQQIADFFIAIRDVLQTLGNLLGMLFRGEIDLYGLFELLDVDQEFLDFLIKIGITPKEEEPAA